jgi:hypothetical protein
MNRWSINFDTSTLFLDPAGALVLYEDHQEIIRRQASAALAGMDAAMTISSHQLKAATRARNESAPEALESERAANARLTEEIESLRLQLECAHGAQREAEAETGRALAAHAIETRRLTAELTDACHDIEHMTGPLCQQALLISTLRGVSTCATCGACRGAAQMALDGLDPHIPFWPPREAEHGDICYGYGDFHLEGLRCWLCGAGG